MTDSFRKSADLQRIECERHIVDSTLYRDMHDHATFPEIYVAPCKALKNCQSIRYSCRAWTCRSTCQQQEGTIKRSRFSIAGTFKTWPLYIVDNTGESYPQDIENDVK